MTLPAGSTAGIWKIDPAHSVVEFRVRHMMISNVKGHFTGVEGFLSLDDDDITASSVHASVEVNSIDTRDEARDSHLKSADFFDVERFPAITLNSTAVTRKGPGELIVAGDLTIRGVTRNVEFAAEGPTPPTKDPWGGTRLGLTATTRINRRDFGLIWNSALEAGGVLVGDEVTITLDLQLIRA